MKTTEAIQKRQSIRAYLKKPVEETLLNQLLETAKLSPSSVNSQPWRLAVVQGESLSKLTADLIAASPQEPRHEVPYYPERWFEPFLSRRRACGLALYGALQIQRRDIERQKEARLNNFRFFGAPVGVILFTHKNLAPGSLVDAGMLWQTLMLAATEAGLGTCALGSLAEYPDVVRASLSIDDEWKVIGGMALGWPDMQHPANGFRTEREPLENLVWRYA
ncbi:MAG: nitroreductase [Campylobacterales bacterium]